MEVKEWSIKNQNSKYKFGENPSKESSINISKEIFDFLGGKKTGDIITVVLHKKDFLYAFSKIISNLPLYYYQNGVKKAEFSAAFFDANYQEIQEHFGKNESIQYNIKLKIDDTSTIRYYLYRIDGAKNFILRDFLIGENSVLKFIKNDNGEIIIEPVIKIANDKHEEPKSQSSKNVNTPKQIIYYGVPGSGKSHTIDNEIQDIPDEQKIRVVFHPEYTNADFVGQILPKTNGGNVQYEFKPGPFTKILYRAYHNPQKKYYLIIEEINRGNAAAIFGDVFQLLDRIEDKSETLNGNTFSIGWSKYFVENDYINNYIRSPIEYSQEGFSENHGKKSVPFGENITFTENTGIRLPPNLSLYATMNTSDQNVFTLDNAFQRRWDMKLVENKFEDTDAVKQKDAKIGGTNVTWGDFQTHINSKIGELTSSMGMSSMEDKRLGCWFVKAKGEAGKNTISQDDFAEKVLKYLWDDAFKFNREDIFNIAEKSTSLEEIINQFKGDEGKSCNWNIFKDTSFIKPGEQLNNSAESNSTTTTDSESSSV